MQNKNTNPLLRSMKTIKKSDIILFIMDFLYNEHLDKALISLEQETNISLFNYPKELLVLRNLILEGNWNESEEILNSINQNNININNFPYRKALFELKKQQFLEAVESEPNQSSNGGDVENLVAQLKYLQTLCPPDEFKKILQCLSQTPSITDQEEYKNWSPITGRLMCFDKIRNYLKFIYPIRGNEVKIENNLMSNVIKAVYFLSTNDASYREFSNLNDVLKGFIIEVDKDIKENNLQMNINIENDVNKNKINASSSQQINVMKSNRNELILSQSQNQLILNNNNNINSNNNNINNNNNDNININNINNEPTNKMNNINHNTNINNINNINNNRHINNNNNILEKPYSEENDYSSKNRDTAINMNTNTNNSNNNMEENNTNQTQPQGENNICESSTNINLNNNLTLEDYACIGNGYTKFSKYDISSYDLSKVIEDSHPIRTSCFSPKGDCLAIGTNSKSLKIYSLSHILSNFKKYSGINTATKMPLIFEQKNHHLGSLYCLDWSVSGRLLASGSNDKVIKLMVVPPLSEGEGKNNEDDDILELPISGHNGTIRSICFDPSSDLTLLTAGDLEKNIKIWDTENGSSKGELIGHNKDVTTIKWSNDGSYFGSGSADKTIKLWDLKSLKEICTIPTLGYGPINDISLLNTGEMIIIAAGHVDGNITIWDAQRKSLFTEIKENSQGKEIRTICFSPDGKYLISGGFDNKIKIYDILNNFNLASELEHNDKVVSVKWHPDLPIIVSTSADKTARIWSPTIY